jgi:hypothetical protein
MACFARDVDYGQPMGCLYIQTVTSLGRFELVLLAVSADLLIFFFQLSSAASKSSVKRQVDARLGLSGNLRVPRPVTVILNIPGCDFARAGSQRQ